MNLMMQCVKNSAVIVFAVSIQFYNYKTTITIFKIFLTCEFADFVGVLRQVHENSCELEQQQEEMNRRVKLADQDGPGDEAENEVTEALH